MKKAIISPLCSAFVIPGLGQILNQQLKKATIILAAVLVLFVTLVIKLYFVLGQVFNAATTTSLGTGALVKALKAQDLTTLFWIIGISTILWVYSVADAFFYGLKQDRQTRDKP